MGNVLMQAPAPFAVRFTVMVQEPLAGIEPPVKVTLELPWMAAIAPPQVVLARPDTSMLAGMESVSGAVNAAAVLFGLLKVMTRMVFPPATMLAGLKALASSIKPGVTVNVATDAPALLPLPVCKAPAASELM